MKLVDRVSACLDCHEHIPLDVRHAMMNKYRGPEDPNFKLVSGRIKDVVDKIRADRSLTREEKECMQALSFHYQDQKDINPERVQGTCEWFLKHPKFLAWRRDTIANLLWVTAGPGCGKSVLSKALVDEGLLNPENPDSKTTSVCYYFFKDDTERGSGVNALRSILHQLFKQKLWLIQHAINDYSTDGPNLSFGTLWAILIKAVSDTNAGPVICVLDALDECETSTRKSLIKNISSFHCASKTTSSTLKFIVTSRPYHELDINFKVDDLPSIHLEGNQMSEEIRGEIDLVISHEISRIGGARQPPLDGEIQASLIQHLQDQKNRTYLWVYLMLQEISKSLESTKGKLIGLLGTIPSSVDEAYEKILKRATDPIQAQKVLCLILAAERPLTLKEMNTAFEILVMNERGEKCTSENDLVLDKEEPFRKKIVNLCGLFVTIVDSKIYLIHQTAKEFLINKNGSTNPWSPSCWKYTFTLQASHLEALKACLWYLRLDFQDIPSSSRKDHPLLLYASIHWTFHFQQAGEKADKELGENALQICNTKAQTSLFWYRILQKHRPYDYLPAENNSDLLIACYFGLTSVVQLLLWDKPNIDIESKDTEYDGTLLLWASKNGHVEVVKLLLKKEADVNAPDLSGGTPLHQASKNGHVEVIKLLLKKEADVNALNCLGSTPLHRASGNRHVEVVKLLLDKEADVNAANKEGLTPLHQASENGHVEVIKLLLDKEADVNAANNEGSTPLTIASGNGHVEIVKLLLDKEANVNAANNEGLTPLHVASEFGNDEVVKLLLGVGKVKADLKDIRGQTPLLHATERGHEAIVKLLLKHVN
jgi:ankyrin repeat protein